jgi:hypothetical protein
MKKQKKRPREYGRSWHPQLPRGDISWLVANYHVGTSGAEIADEVARRLSDPRCTPAIRQEAREYALACHADNGQLYTDVTSGNIGAAG